MSLGEKLRKQQYDAIWKEYCGFLDLTMQDYMKINHADLIDRIEQQKALSKEDEQLLTEAVKEFKKSGAF